MQILNLLTLQNQTAPNKRINCKNTVQKPWVLSFKSAGDIFIKSSENVIQDVAKSDLIPKIISIFKNSAECAPKGLDIKTSSVSNQVLSFTKDLKKGKKLIATKQFIHKNCKNYFYISLKEYKDNELCNAFAIDMDTLDIVKLRQKGNIRFKDEDFIRITPNNPNYDNYSKKLSEYIDAVYSGRENNTVTSLMTTKTKQTSQNPFKITIDDLLDDDQILEVPKEIPIKEFVSTKKESEKHITTTVKKPLLHVEKTLPANKNPQVKKMLSVKKIRTPKPKVKTKSPLKIENTGINLKSAQLANIKPTIISNSQAGRHTINKTPCGELPFDLSTKLLKTEENLTKIAVLLNDHRGNIGKIKYLKSNYEPIEYSANRQKTINFRLTNNNILGIIHTKTSERFTRIIFKDSTGNETHFLIENRNHIVSNLNKKKPWIVPMKFRYMTDEQIKASNIDKYIEFLEKEVQRYYTYLKENL